MEICIVGARGGKLGIGWLYCWLLAKEKQPANSQLVLSLSRVANIHGLHGPVLAQFVLVYIYICYINSHLQNAELRGVDLVLIQV